VAYQQVIDLYYKYEDDDYLSEQTGGINAITPAVGLQLTPAVSIGATINIYTGTSTDKVEDSLDPMNDYEDETKFSGTNFTLGGLFDLNQLRLGVILKTPFSLTMTDEENDYELILTMPQMLGIGGAFAVNENLTVAADFEMRKYSESEFEYDDGSTQDAEFEDMNQLRVGAEYLYMSGDSILPIRIGFATTPLLFVDDNDDQIKGINLTGGIGLIMGNLNLDLGVEYNTYSHEYSSFGDTYESTENYLRFIISGVFHLGQ